MRTGLAAQLVYPRAELQNKEMPTDGGTNDKGNTNESLIDTNYVTCRSIRAVAQPSGGCPSSPMILVD